MSAYISCPKCGEDTLDVDALACDCGYGRDEPTECRINASDAERLLEICNTAKDLNAQDGIYLDDLNYRLAEGGQA